MQTARKQKIPCIFLSLQARADRCRLWRISRWHHRHGIRAAEIFLELTVCYVAIATFGTHRIGTQLAGSSAVSCSVSVQLRLFTCMHSSSLDIASYIAMHIATQLVTSCPAHCKAWCHMHSCIYHHQENTYDPVSSADDGSYHSTAGKRLDVACLRQPRRKLTEKMISLLNPNCIKATSLVICYENF